MNQSNAKILDYGFKEISRLLIQFMSGSSNIFFADQSLILNLNALYLELCNDSNPQQYQILLQKRFERVLVYTMEMSLRRRNLKLLESILDLLVVITSNSYEFVTALMTTNCPILMIDYTFEFSDKDIDLLYSCLLIIFNIIRFKQYRQCLHNHSRISKFKDVLNSVLSVKEKDINMIAYMILGFLSVNNKDKNVLLEHVDIIDSIYDYLSKAFTREDKTYNGSNIWELLIALEALCSIGEIIWKIIEINHFIPTLIKIASSNSSKPQEVTVALEILQNLCIDEKIKQMLLKQYQLDRVIVPLTNSGEDSIKNIAIRLLMRLRELCLNNDNKKVFDAVISYSDSDSDIISKITCALKGKYNVERLQPGCRDFKSTIDRSNILIIGASISYQEDVRCLSEVKYAHETNRQIIPLILIHKLSLSKELKCIIGSNQGIDFSDSTFFQQSIGEMEKVLYENLLNKPSPSIILKNQSIKGVEKNDVRSKENIIFGSPVLDMVKEFDKMECKPSQPVTKSSELTPSSNFEQWTKDQVSKWLTNNDLSVIHNKFSNFDGPMLKAILNMRNKTAPTYYKHMETSMGLEFFEILKFDVALDRIGYKIDT